MTAVSIEFRLAARRDPWPGRAFSRLHFMKPQRDMKARWKRRDPHTPLLRPGLKIFDGARQPKLAFFPLRLELTQAVNLRRPFLVSGLYAPFQRRLPRSSPGDSGGGQRRRIHLGKIQWDAAPR